MADTYAQAILRKQLVHEQKELDAVRNSIKNLEHQLEEKNTIAQLQRQTVDELQDAIWFLGPEGREESAAEEADVRGS